MLTEHLWRTDVGLAYWGRNRPDPKRNAFWGAIREATHPERVLEVGCGRGQNLAAFGGAYRTGIDIDIRQLSRGRICASAGALPFASGAFDLAFTSGLLIHLPEESLPAALDELARVSSKHVLLVEYMDSHRRMIPWHGRDDALWADRFGLLFWRAHPEFAPTLRMELTKREGFDRCTAVLFARQE